MAGFGSAMQTEALPGALPRSQNSPRRAPYGLYAECLNGTPFTQRRAENRRAWMYRIRPSLMQSRMQPVAQSHIVGRFDGARVVPDLVRWKPLPIPDGGHRVDFLDGLRTIGGAGDPDLRSGLAIHAYAANADMSDRCFCDADGDLLIVPERGAMRVQTEYGWLAVRPGEIVVIQRGMKFSVALPEGVGRGWVLEIFGAHFRLPERGPIGANGLADERHFSSPVAAFEDRACPGYEVMVKHGGELFRCTREHSPYDVVAWHGNYAPYKYDLAMFNTMGTVSFDHPDPSILTVLTSPLDDHGANLADFAVFPGRWDVAEHSFRPPYYHRNIATEFNGIVKIDEPYLGFDQGVCFLTPAMTPHGISGKGYLGAIEDSGAGSDQPRRLSDDSLWIMFESALGIRLTAWAMDNGHVDEGYHELWKDMPVTFRRG
ncbi:homogentisate 1,2-dioxygenase [Haliangium sp.]|uniref:homogentisate 1,2-dioxygenase n=1 Tax=Haliangium sp. TaxID=2663208 RepID=UPI003D13B3A9